MKRCSAALCHQGSTNHITTTTRLYWKKWKITSVKEVVEELEPSCTAGGHVKWGSYFGKQFGSSSKGWLWTYRLTQQFRSESVPKRNENVGPPKTSYNIYRSIIHDSQKVGTTAMPINCWMDEQNEMNIHGYSHNGMLINNRKEWNTDPCYNIDETWKHYARRKKPLAKDHAAYDDIYVSCPEYAKRWREKIGACSIVVACVQCSFLWGRPDILKWNCGDGCAYTKTTELYTLCV